MPPPAEPTECVDCAEAKSEAVQKDGATGGRDGLNLGDCAPLYRKWADCVEENLGQAKACATVLAEFRTCHTLAQVPPVAKTR